MALRTTILSSMAAVALFAGAAYGEGAVTNVAADVDADTAAITALQNMALAQQLAALGVETGDPIMLIAAARLASQVSATASDMTPRDGQPSAAGESPGLHSADEMLVAARAFAQDREDILGLIEDAAAETSRGSIYGSGYYDGYISGGDNLYFDEAFYGGEQAIITLQGHNPSDIDLWVYDEYGNLICSSTGYSSNESCSFVPRWTGDFTVRVENEGHPQGTYFTLWTN